MMVRVLNGLTAHPKVIMLMQKASDDAEKTVPDVNRFRG
jgi:hypothetical protein